MKADYSQIPEATLVELNAWIDTARPLGSFTEALVANDLRDAFRRADEDNIRAMFHTVTWLHNVAPAAAWGSALALTTWPRMLGQEDDAG